MNRVYIVSNNYCKEARLETQRLVDIISKTSASRTYMCVNKLEDADLIILYTCGHLQTEETDSISTIKKILKQKKASSDLIVWGCLPKINPKSVRSVHGGLMVGPEDWTFFYELLNQPKVTADEVNANTLSVDQGFAIASGDIRRDILRLVPFSGIVPRPRKKVWYIRIESGCANHCTYCTDKLAYSSIRSQPIERIVQQFAHGLRNGYKYFYFIGRDQGSYGYDMGISLANLLQAIYEKYPHQDYKLLLDQLSPNALIDIYPHLNNEFLSTKVFEIGSHIQSGSDRILRLMGKRFKVQDWIRVIQSISRDHPQIHLHTSMMVGFPSESEQDFKASINLVNSVLFDEISVYKYNERPCLPSLGIRGRIPEKTKIKRERTMWYYAKLNNIRKRINRILRAR